MIRFLRNLFFTNRFWWILAGIVLGFIGAYVIQELSYMIRPGSSASIDLAPIIQLVLAGFLVLTLTDILLLFTKPKGIFARRDTPEKLSNGDRNELSIFIENNYDFPISLRVIDEIPFQFQKRDLEFKTGVGARKRSIINYFLRPTKRGEYSFGAVNLYVASPIGLIRKRYRFSENQVVPVYPSFLQMRKYELIAISNRLTELGIKKIRRIGHSMEFEQIREYVEGDDYRTLNWKATARKGDYMVNQYTEEKSQQVYNIIDKGRLMRMPFEGLSLLDYAINASLVLSNIAIRKEDKAGLVTFSNKIGSFLPADKRPMQMKRILEILHKQKTKYLEADFERLYINIRRKVTQRSLILLYTNFQSLTSLRRQLPYLRAIARDHLLVVIFFEDTETKKLRESRSKNTEQIYIKTIAEQFAFEKKQIVKELNRHGIHAVLTAPQNLTVNTINKYLELKARGMI